MKNNQNNKENGILHPPLEYKPAMKATLQVFKNSGLSPGSRLSSGIPALEVDWKFVKIGFAAVLLWVVVNVYLMNRPFNPYALVSVNLVFSSMAALQSTISLLIKKRKKKKDGRQALTILLRQLKAETAVRNLHGKIDLLINSQHRIMTDRNRSPTGPAGRANQCVAHHPANIHEWKRLQVDNHINI